MAIPNPQAVMDMNERPRETCHVEFFIKAVKDGVKSTEAGRAIYNDVEYARLTPPGGNLIINKVVSEQVIDRFRPQYEAWKRNEEMPENGTHVRLWPVATPAEVKMFLEAGVRTIEAVSEMNENCIQKVGMGARALKEKAQAWLKSADEKGTFSEKINTMKVENDDLRLQNEQLISRNEELKGKLLDGSRENKAADVSDLQDILAELKTENAKIHADLKESHSKNNESGELILKLKHDLQGEKKKCSDLRAKIKKAKGSTKEK
jgi:hypothetical protein